VKAERAAREQARRQSKAATLIQKLFRGHATRRQARLALKSQWLAEFGASAAQVDIQLSADTLTGTIPCPLMCWQIPACRRVGRCPCPADWDTQHLPG
jgi:IQ calmodulin-binding motif